MTELRPNPRDRAIRRLLAILVGGALPVASATVLSLDGEWLLAVDPQNVGREQKWCDGPVAQAKSAKVPWIIQEAFPGYHGVAWYWRDFVAPAKPQVQGRYLLRFWAVDYMADVWLNGVPVGGHEGGEGVFVLDVTDALRPKAENKLAVRVLNPSNERIDGITLAETAHYAKSTPFSPGLVFNPGGIVDSVELLVSPLIRVEDLHVRPEWKTGSIKIRANIRNAGQKTARASLAFTVAPAASGETLAVASRAAEIEPGDTLVESELAVKDARLWDLNDPCLYRVTARVQDEESASFDEASTRCGFRDFRFENGYFRLNGRRIFLKSSHTATIYPIGLHWPHDPDVARREMIQTKTMGFNAIRFFCSAPARYQLDLCDELGFMIYEETFAGWFLADSPRMGERLDHEVSDVIKRDRNHPCVIMWGLLNETPDGPVFRHAVDMLPLVRSLDDTRVVMLNSGRSDGVTGGASSGGLAGISIWQDKSGGLEPNVTYNDTKAPVNALGVLWEPGRLSLHPGPSGEFSVLRWTAPSAGDYRLAGKFLSIAERATTDAHVLHNGKSIFDSFINLEGNGMGAPFAADVSVKAGDTIDFIVGWGNGEFGGDSTGVEAAIKSADGKTHDPAKEFSVEQNPNGFWSYGRLKPGASPDSSTFALYGKGRVIGASGPTGAIGSLSNPGSRVWEDVVSDQHPYQRVPHTAAIVRTLRTLGGGKNPVFMSEYGIGSSLDLVKMTRQYEQLGAEHLEDAQWYRAKLAQFMADWKRWNLQDTFASPEDYFNKCLARMGEQRKLGLNCIRANPNCVGHSMTGTTDCGDAGEGVVTLFRELKPGTVDGIFDGWYPLRWCLFVEPVQAYRRTPAHLEAVLANEDALKPGEYPVRVQVVGPNALSVFDKTISVTIPGHAAGPEPSFAMPVFSEDVVIDGPSGEYRFLVTFQKGGAAAGGDVTFYAADPADMPAINGEVVLWGEDEGLGKWLGDRGIKVRRFSSGEPAAREVILIGNQPADGASAWRNLVTRIGRGSTAVFLVSSVFAKKDQPCGWVPLVNKGSVAVLPSWLYHKDEWVKNHPIFDGLPAGRLMDYTFYRDIIPDHGWVGQDVPTEVVAGAINTSIDYSAGLLVSVNNLGAGRFILNTLLIRENLAHNPVAERLLRNMLNYAARDQHKPLAGIPPDFETQLKTLGY
jgi:hypothetical protein